MNEYGKNCFVIDWFSASCVLDAGTSWIDMLPILGLEKCNPESFTDGWGHHGYKKSRSNLGIRIYYDFIEDDNVVSKRYWVEMSGRGCRTFETLSTKTFTDLFKRIPLPRTHLLSALHVNPVSFCGTTRHKVEIKITERVNQLIVFLALAITIRTIFCDKIAGNQSL